MPMPQFSPPVLPTRSSPSSTASSKTCGDSWSREYEARSPYKSVDKYVDILPPIFLDPDLEFGSGSVEDSFPIASSYELRKAVEGAIKGAKEILDDYKDNGYIDPANNTAIKKIIAQAETYRAQAYEMWNWWKDDFQPDTEKPVYGWPLVDNRMAPCTDWAPAVAGITVDLPGQGPTLVEFRCPTITHRDDHKDGRDVFATMMRATVITIRCAQEAAATVGIYNRNKKLYEASVSGGMQLGKAKPAGRTGSIVSVSVDTGEPDPGEPEGEMDEPGEEATTTTTTKKKKSGGVLLLAAAGLGLLMMGKK